MTFFASNNTLFGRRTQYSVIRGAKARRHYLLLSFVSLLYRTTTFFWCPIFRRREARPFWWFQTFRLRTPASTPAKPKTSMVKSTLLSLSKSMVSLQNGWLAIFQACQISYDWLWIWFLLKKVLIWKLSNGKVEKIVSRLLQCWNDISLITRERVREKRHCTGVCWWNVEIEQLVTWHALSVRKKMGEIWLHVHSVYWNPQNNVPICRWKRNLLFCLWYWHSDSTDRLTLRRFKKAEQNHIQTL